MLILAANFGYKKDAIYHIQVQETQDHVCILFTERCMDHSNLGAKASLLWDRTNPTTITIDT